MLTGVAVAFVVAGFLLMLPETDVRNTVGGRYAAAPGPGAFEARRIRAAPIPCFIGFVLMVPAILWVPRGRRDDDNIPYPIKSDASVSPFSAPKGVARRVKV